MNIGRKLYKAGVLLIAAVMVLSVIPAVTADTSTTPVGDDVKPTAGISNGLVPIQHEIMLTGFTVPYGEGTLGGGTFAPGDLLYEQIVHDPSQSWSFATSDAGPGYKVYENFPSLAGPIGKLDWWGLTLIYPWAQGDPDGMNFYIEFYSDDPTDTGSMPPTDLVASFDVSVDAGDVVYSYTGDYYAGFACVYFEFDLPSDVNLPDGGWVSIQSHDDPDGDWFLWGSAQSGDFFSYQEGSGPTSYDRALRLFEGGGAGGDCIPGACDFRILGVNNLIDGEKINSLPAIINISIGNYGEIPIFELKLLADVYEKVCGDSNSWCDDLEKDKYDPRWDSDNENWSTYDDPADDADDEGDTFVLQQDDFHSGNQAYRCTKGKYRSTADDDVYVGRSAAINDDYLEWHPANVSRRTLAGAAGAIFTFWHKCTGEYTTDEDGNVIPIDYGYIEYSLDDGATWIQLPLSDFIAYDNGWEQWTIKFINTAANGGHYDKVCDLMACDDDNPRTICIEEDFTAVGATFLRVRFLWHVNPCNEFEGWYIDDVCFERVEEYELHLVHQTHEIIELDPCVFDMYYEFPLGFDPEPDTWYQLCVYGQVFSPQDCEADLENNELCVQFYVTDIHDIACVGMSGPDHLDIGEHGMYEVTVKNVGTYAEANFPVELKVAKRLADTPIDDDFETDPGSRWAFYYFYGYDPTNYFQWTDGIDVIVGARSKLPGEESIICADIGYEFPMLKSRMGNLMTDDNVYDFSDLGCGESATLEFSAKWAIPAGVGGACMLVHPVSGPDSAYWWIINFGAWNPPTDSYTNEFIDFVLDVPTMQSWFAYEEHGVEITPAIEFGFGLITFSGITDYVVSTPEGPWGGVMYDNIKLTHVYADGSMDVVDVKLAGTTAPLFPGDEETLELWWNDTQYCNWIVFGDAQLSTDVNPANDICCVPTNVTSMAAIDDETHTADLTCCDTTSLWHLCTSRPPMDDTFWWCGNSETGFYEPNMDDALIVQVNLSNATGGAILEFDTYYMIEYGYDFGEVYARADDESAWIMIGGPYTGYEDWHIETCTIPAEACTKDSEIKFRFISDAYVQDEGWYVDDICFYTIPGVAEDFESGVPPTDWEEIVYGGTGHWGVGYTTGSWKDPWGASGQYAIADSDAHSSWVFDVGLRSPKMDLNGLSTGDVTMSCGLCYENFAGWDDAYVRVWSDAGLEEVLGHWDYDMGPFPFSATLDLDSYTSLTDVQIEFYYTTNGYSWLWFYSVDNVHILVNATGSLIACDDLEDGLEFEYTTHVSCGGDFWEYTTELLYGFTDDYDGDGYVWYCHDYPSENTGLNDALYVKVDLTDEALAMAVVEFAHQWIMEPGCAAIIEISDDYDGDPCGDATWIMYYKEEIPSYYPDGGYIHYTYPDWQVEHFDLSDYIGKVVWLRFRYITPGNGMYIFPGGGWMVDGFSLIYKEQVFEDTTPPVTTLVWDDLTGTFSLFAYDPAGPASSGVCATYYKLDGGATTEYTGPVTLSEGTHTVEYWSVDCAGNEESHKTSPQLVVDTTPPTVTITQPEDALYLFGSKILSLSKPLCIGKITIVADASDAGTGVTMVTFDIDGDSGYDTTAPYEYTYRGMHFGAATVTVTAYDGKGLTAQASKDFTIFSLGLI